MTPDTWDLDTGPRRRNRRHDLNDSRSNRSEQLFKAQLAEGFGRRDQLNGTAMAWTVTTVLPREPPEGCTVAGRLLVWCSLLTLLGGGWSGSLPTLAARS